VAAETPRTDGEGCQNSDLTFEPPFSRVHDRPKETVENITASDDPLMWQPLRSRSATG
jgi:hypothetical protein